MKDNRTLWYQQPASSWDQALPLGNGRLGGMVFGQPEQEHIQLNEDSIWYGKPINRINPDCLPNLEKIRSLIFSGKIQEAEQLCLYAMSGLPQSERVYQTLGDLTVQFHHGGAYEKYSRELDLKTAVSTVRYRVGDTVYTRTAFLSAPDDVLVLRITAQGGNRISCHCLLDRRRFLDHSGAVDDRSIFYDGNCGEGGVRFCGMLSGRVSSGTVKTMGEHLIVEDAAELLLVFTAATSFRTDGDLQKHCADQLNKAVDKGFDALLADHIKDYRRYFDRMDLSFGDTRAQQPTDRRLHALQEGKEDTALLELYFHYARYLLISSSRQGTLPANLQGIWNGEYLPSWDSKYTININTEMNYWIAESCNLPEMHQPLFDLIHRMLENGRRTAWEMYRCRGFVAHHNTDLYGDTAPQDHYIPASYWVMGGAWLCLHIWEHYLYTRDEDELKRNYECLKQAALFFEDFLVEDGNGQLVTCPSVSPENTYVMADGTSGRLCAGCSMDNQILYELFHAYLDAGKLIGMEDDERKAAENILARLPVPTVGKHGQLMEWAEDYDEAEPGHRHISHLFGVYPGRQFSYEQTPELMDAAETTLTRRLQYGGGHTGWSRAWIINLWARFRQGDKAYENALALLERSTFDNLFDNHPMGDGYVFQIDGNFGAAAGMVEMLMQSSEDEIHLLPALPSQLPDGSVSGMKTRTGAALAFEWRAGRLDSCTLSGERDREITLRYKDTVRKVSLKAGLPVILDF